MDKIKNLFTLLTTRAKGLLNSRKRIAIFIILILILAFAGWKVLGNKQQQPQYQTAKVERGTIVSSISASGQIITANIISVTTNASGVVKQVFVKDGDTVFADQNIAEITLDASGQQKNAQAWSSYLSAKNSLESAKATQYSLQSDMFTKWDDFKNLAESSTYQNPDGTPRYEQRALPEFHIAENDWLAAEAKYKNQQNVISQAQNSVSSAWLSYQAVSPIVTALMSGIITNITYSPGMTISASADSSQRIAVIKSEGTPLATFNISEIDVSKVKPGQKATIKLDSIADKTFTGKVLTVDRIGTVTSGVTNYPVVIQFDTEAPEILPNMAATASIILETKDNVLLIPSSAIQRQGNQNVVRIMKGKKEQTITVEIGLISDTQTEILSGLSEGDEVVISTVTPSGGQQGGGSVFGGGGAGRMFMGR